MSQQIQYNYYNTLATKIDDHTFIFRGKTNMPNLTLSDSRTYVSTKLTIRPSEGIIEIEHEPITNYSKKVIATIPLHLDIDSDSAEINLNKLIPKSIRFRVDEMKDAIYLKPDTAIQTKEGFCSKKDAKKLKDELRVAWSKDIKTHAGGPHGAVGNLSDAELKYLANKLNPMMNDGKTIDTANGDWECTPFDINTDTSTTVTLAESNQVAKTENSIYQQASLSLFVVIAVIFIINKVVCFLHNYVADKVQDGKRFVKILLGMLILIIITSIVLSIFEKTRAVAIGIVSIMVFIIYFIYKCRQDAYVANRKVEVVNHNTVPGYFESIKLMPLGLDIFWQLIKRQFSSNAPANQ